MKYAVLIKRQQYIEGDERSRTNPGHGYPAHTVEYTELKEFLTESELTEWLVRYSEREKFRIIKFEDVQFEKKISYKLDK